MSDISDTNDRVLAPGQVADLFAVDPKTVTRWAKQGLLPSFTTPGGHRRYRWSDIEPHLRQGATQSDDDAPAPAEAQS